MNFFLKHVGLPQKGSGSFGIDTKTVSKKFGGPTMFRTSNIDLVPSQSQNVSHESEIVEPGETGFETEWNQAFSSFIWLIVATNRF